MKIDTLEFVLLAAVVAHSVAGSPGWAVEENHSGGGLPSDLRPAYADGKRLVADSLPLTPSKAGQFWPVYELFEQEQTSLAERRRALMGKFGQNFEAMSERSGPGYAKRARRGLQPRR